ncbi:MAG: hypothetical protein L3J41_15485 [Melioribacteraceae bacterium]|nr:hypothetical protein [Melioribacteraceae bacterium]
MIGKCKLCNKSEELQNSHIIPNYFFKRLKRNGSAIQTEVTVGIPNIKTQDSWSEYLFCKNCEQHINKFEKYVISFTKHPFNVKSTADSKDNNIVQFSNLDYERFRLFQLSLLFRAAIASGREWATIKLSKTKKEEIRLSILTKKLPDELRYACQMKILWDFKNNTPLDTIVMIPIKKILTRGEIIYFVFGGFAWEFFVPKLSRKTEKDNYFIRTDGTLLSPIMDYLSYKPLIELLPLIFLKEKIGLTKL